MRTMIKFGLTAISTGHVTKDIGNYQEDIDAADPGEVLGKSWKARKGSKGKHSGTYVKF